MVIRKVKSSLTSTASVLLMLSGVMPAHADQPNEEVRKLIDQVQDLKSKCRGSGDDPYTYVACFDMQKPTAKLEHLGWCYGPIGDPGYKQRWIPCTSDPKRLAHNSAPPVIQASNWKRFSSDTYTLAPEVLTSPFLIATMSKGKIFLNLMEPNSDHCSHRSNSGPDSSSPYLINDTYVKFQSFCVDGNRIFYPSTEAGKSLLLNSIESGSTKIEVERLPPLIFFKTDFESVKRELRKTESAL